MQSCRLGFDFAAAIPLPAMMIFRPPLRGAHHHGLERAMGRERRKDGVHERETGDAGPSAPRQVGHPARGLGREMKEVKGMWMGPGLTLEELLDQPWSYLDQPWSYRRYGNVDGSRPENGPKVLIGSVRNVTEHV